MLGKLLKYELKSTARIFLPLYIAILGVALINGFMYGGDNFIFPTEGSTALFTARSIATMVLGSLFIALFVITIILIIQRFKKNLLEDEGYLMFTLPVSTKSLVLSKFITSLIWAFLSGIVAILAFTLVTFISTGQELGFSYYIEGFKTLFGALSDSETWIIIIEMIAMTLIGYSTFIFTVYLALSMGQLPIFNKYRTGASFISFFVINIIITNIQRIVSYSVGGMLEINADATGITNIVSNGILSTLLINLVILIALFISTSYILEKKLNLE